MNPILKALLKFCTTKNLFKCYLFTEMERLQIKQSYLIFQFSAVKIGIVLKANSILSFHVLIKLPRAHILSFHVLISGKNNCNCGQHQL